MARLEPAGGQSYEDISLRHMFLDEVAPVQSVGKFTHHSYLDTFDERDAELSRQGICNFLIFGRIAEKYIQTSAFIDLSRYGMARPLPFVQTRSTFGRPRAFKKNMHMHLPADVMHGTEKCIF